jgi:hypothetical protein
VILNFGQHRGLSITKAPKDYLRYLLTQTWLKSDLRGAIEKTLNGNYVSPVAVPPKTEPYDPNQFLPKPIDTEIEKAMKKGASVALQMILKEFVNQGLDDATKAKVMVAIYDVSQKFA